MLGYVTYPHGVCLKPLGPCIRYAGRMIPQKLRAGSAYTWTENKFSAGDGDLEYTLFNENAVYTLTAADSVFTITSAVSKSWRNGMYRWVLRRVVGTEKTELVSGTLEIEANPDIMPNGLDGRSHAERTLAAIEALIEGRASDDIEEFSIRGKTIKSMPIAELLKFRNIYRSEVASEARSRRINAGLPSGRIINTRFV